MNIPEWVKWLLRATARVEDFLYLPLWAVACIQAVFYARRMLKMINRYGPDLARRASRNLSFDEVAKETVGAYLQETGVLLPRRYTEILRRLLLERLITQENYTLNSDVGTLVVLGGRMTKFLEDSTVIEIPVVPFVWVRDPAIFKNASGSLRGKIQSFEKDCREARSYQEGAKILLELLNHPPGNDGGLSP